MPKLSDWLVHPIVQEDITKNPKIKRALSSLVKKNLLPKTFATDVKKLQSFLTQNPQVFTTLLKLLGESDYTFGPEWSPTSITSRKKMKELYKTTNGSIREGKEDVVVIYSGRFQPFHTGHYSTYNKLVQKFGKDSVYIGTSNKTESGRSPLTFKEKKSIITKFFNIPANKIVQVRNPYSPVEILKGFSKNTTYIAAVGEKDSQRLKGKYFKPYKPGKTAPYEERGFVLAVPPTNFKVGGESVSGTKVRATFGGSVGMSAKEELFKRMYGKIDKKILQFLIKKFGGTITEATTSSDGNMDDGPPTYYGSYADYKKYSTAWLLDLYGEDWKVLSHLISSDFDPLEDYTLKYNTVPAVSYLDAGSVKGSKHAVDKYKDFIQKIVDDFGWDVVKWMGVDAAQKNIIGTVLAPGVGKDLSTQDDIKENVFSKSKQLFIEEKELLLMGGAYGHLAHPFDDNRLTFRDLKTMIDLALQGKLESVSEKTDGQNLMISYIDGKVRAARNKGQLKNFGKNSLDIKGIKNMFSGRGEIENAFVYSMVDLEKSIKKLSKANLEKIFENGKSFMSLEVIYGPTTNVIPYGINMLVFHGTITYNEKGEPIGQNKSAGSTLTKLIKKINSNVQKHFNIQALPNTKLPKVKNYESKKSTFLGKVTKLQSDYSLSDTDTLADYHQHFWLEWILNGSNQTDFANQETSGILYKLMKRWAFFDKSYKISQIKKDLKEYPKFLEWVLATDKQDHIKMMKDNISKFERIFLDLGAEVLSNMENFLSANPTQAAVAMRKDIAKTIKKIRSSKDLRVIDNMKTQLVKVQSMGGFKKLVPTEGITFMFNGKIYKLTGLFAPINQILGMLKYAR